MAFALSDIDLNSTLPRRDGFMDFNPTSVCRSLMGLVASMSVLAFPLHAQSVLFRWDGFNQNDGFGWSVSTMADTTGDGVPEVLVGAFQADCGGSDFGATYSYSGSDGSTIITECGTGRKFAVEGLGWSVSPVDDLDGDGVVDFVVGGPAYVTAIGISPGRACVYSGSTGGFVYQVVGEQTGNVFGAAVAGIGDLDGDGRGDFIVGAIGYSNTYPSGVGRAYVYSGASGASIRIHEGEEQYDHFGWNAAGLGDVNADGVPDYGVMATYDPAVNYGAVYVYSGASGSSLYKWTGTLGNDYFGQGLDGRLDWNGDGFGDVLVGAPESKYENGNVYIYSGKDGSVLATIDGEVTGTGFGYSVANVGDMNHDGFPEILIGEPSNADLGTNTGRATLVSGSTLRRLYHFHGSGASNVQFGNKVAGGRDYNGDGIPDVLISEPYGSSQDPKGGRVTLFAGNDLFLQSIPNTVTAGDSLELDTRGGPPNVLAALVIEDIGGTPCFLLAQVATLDANGEMALGATVPSGLAGFTITLQAFAQHAPGKHGYVDSDREVISIY